MILLIILGIGITLFVTGSIFVESKNNEASITDAGIVLTIIFGIVCTLLFISYEIRRTSFVLMEKTNQSLTQYYYSSYKEDSINAIWGAFFPDPDKYNLWDTKKRKK